MSHLGDQVKNLMINRYAYPMEFLTTLLLIFGSLTVSMYLIYKGLKNGKNTIDQLKNGQN